MIYFQKDFLIKLKGVERKKYLFKRHIIKYLFLHGESTCNDIGQHVKLSMPSVQASIYELKNEGVIEERGQGVSSGGRRPIIYGLREESFYFLGLDIGRYHVRLAILDNNRNIITGIKIYEIKFVNDFSYLDKIIEYVSSLIKTSGIDKKKLIGIGMDMPGVIDSEKGINYSYLYNPDESLTETLEKRFNLPVFLENDANARALAEYWFGHARDKKNAIVLLLSWGIGLGLILNGELYQGANGFAGEFSHIPFKDDGKLCWCNKRGCLETVASATALSALAKEGLSSGNISSIVESVDDKKEYIDPDIIISAANQGDQFAIKILSEVSLELGKGIAVLIQILNPEVIILGGRMARAKQYIVTPIQHALNSYCNPTLLENVSIEITNFKEEAAILGSAVLVMNKLLNNK